MLVSDRVLVQFNEEFPVFLVADASQYGIGAALEHEIRGRRQPICFASRVLSKAEKNYSQMEKEGLAIIFGVKKFDYYLFGRKFTILTDHKPLLKLFGEHEPVPEMVSPRVMRWSLDLKSKYTYCLRFIKGKENYCADALSRLPSGTLTPRDPPDLERVLLINEDTRFVKINEIRR